MTRIRLPHEFTYRDYQLPLRDFMLDGGKRACAVWHRRAGKDTTALRVGLELAIQRPANYWHMLPSFSQGRRAIWEGINPHTGRRIIDEVFPKALVTGTNTTEMRVDLANGSTWSVVGSDNFDRLVGAPPAGVVMSEWALADPRAWAYLEPILVENDGWAMFIYTPRGRNHGFKTYSTASTAGDWFGQRLTIEDTGVIGEAAIRKLRREGVAEAYIQQEYFCSFDSPLIGAYYADQLFDAEQEGRIGKVPHDPSHLVNTAWDIGFGDATAIWFYQDVAGARHFIAYYEADGFGVEHYVKLIRQWGEERKYEYGTHWGPHDLDSGDWATGRKRIDVAAQLGLRFEIVPKSSVEDGIQAVRSMLPRCWFDAVECEKGLDALRSYRREPDESKAQDMDKPFFKPRPLHDWSSHSADSIRYAALAEVRRKGQAVFKTIEYPDSGVPL